jgi:enoyl-CoA hydratase/carnithine racemase
MTAAILLNIDNKIATITLNRPEVMNAINEEMLPLWVDALEHCRTDPDVDVIIVTGAGDSFCRGGDVSKLGAHTEPNPLEVKQQFWDRLHTIPKKLAEIDKPVIAAINGLASGAGVDVALHCDLRFASQSTNFRVSYTAFGLVPGNGGTYYLPRIVGEAKALELFWSAEPFDVHEALAMNLVNKVFPDDELMERTIEFARKISENAPLPVRMIKRAVKQGATMDLNTHLDMISSHMIVTRMSEDHAEGIKAWDESRKPIFKGK